MKFQFMSESASAGKKMVLAGAVLVGVLQVSQPAHADKAVAAKELQSSALEEVVVTAQRKEESAQKVPLTVSALSGDDIKRLAITEPKDLQFSTPALTFTQDNATINPYIRGRGTNFSGIGLEGSVPIYIDDVYLETQFGAEGLVDIARLQVLKGPQGTLYGRNATGGVILFETNNPTQKFEGHVEAGGGNLGQVKGEAVVNVPVTSTFALRLAAGYQNTDGYLNNVANGETVGELKRHQIRLKALYSPTDNFSALLKLEHNHSVNSYVRRQIFDGTGTPTSLKFYETFQSSNHSGANNPDPLDTSDVDSYTLRLNYKSANWALTNVTGYRNTRLHTCADNDNLTPDFVVFCVNAPPGAPGFAGGIEGAYDHSLTDELRFVTNFSGPLNATFGGSYQRSKARFPTVLRGLVFGPLVIISDSYTEIKTPAVFAELYYDILQNLKLTAGGRYSSEKRDLNVVNNADTFALGVPLPAFATFAQSAKFHSFTPRVVLAYDAGAVNYYASYNEGYKSGGFNVPPFVPFNDQLDEEKTKGFEIGAKAKFWDNRARLDVAVFETKTTGLQVSVVNPSTNSVIQQNAAETKAHGVEVNLEVKPLDRLTLRVGAAQLHSRFESFKAASVFTIQGGVLGTALQDLSGTPTTNSPNFTANLSATYELPLQSGWGASVTASGRTSTSYDFTPGAGGQLQSDRQKSFSVVELSGQITSPNDKYTVYLWANNLFDEKYFNIVQSGGASGVYAIPALPRTIGASLRYSF